jgi:hypothetical protein
MKLPRWLVVCMLSVSGLSVSGYAGWWWVTWPERTAREYVDCLREWRITDLAQMTGEPIISDASTVPLQDVLDVLETDDFKEFRASFRNARLELAGSRTILDLILSRRRFRVAYGNAPETGWLRVERGKVFSEETVTSN